MFYCLLVKFNVTIWSLFTEHHKGVIPDPCSKCVKHCNKETSIHVTKLFLQWNHSNLQITQWQLRPYISVVYCLQTSLGYTSGFSTTNHRSVCIVHYYTNNNYVPVYSLVYSSRPAYMYYSIFTGTRCLCHSFWYTVYRSCWYKWKPTTIFDSSNLSTTPPSMNCRETL